MSISKISFADIVRSSIYSPAFTLPERFVKSARSFMPHLEFISPIFLKLAGHCAHGGAAAHHKHDRLVVVFYQPAQTFLLFTVLNTQEMIIITSSRLISRMLTGLSTRQARIKERSF